uniref:F-box domain-containing protein n=1 Tax=Cuerna arida TaxID=1464854 RepID=A0A1B6G1L8_9HEMI
MEDKKSVEDLGQYITNEYGLLKEILSNLNPIDLWSARLVCRKWKSTVDLIVNKDPIVLPSHKVGKKFPPPVVPQRILPTVIIQQHLFENSRNQSLEICRRCGREFYVCPCVISTPTTAFISISCTREKCSYEASLKLTTYQFWHSHPTLILPTSQGIKITPFCIMKGAKILRKPITNEIVSRCIGGEEPIKCLLIISKTRSAKFVSSLLKKIVDRQGKTFAAGGGEIKHYECNAGNRRKITTGRYHSLWFVPSYVFIAFRGDGVSAHSEILYYEDAKDINIFMKQLAERVGPVPEGGSRIAFLAQCVARTDPFLENEESSAFNRAFPSVPQFGFHALGEYGMSSSSTEAPEEGKPSKKMKYSFEHVNTTSITIITFSKVKFNK